MRNTIIHKLLFAGFVAISLSACAEERSQLKRDCNADVQQRVLHSVHAQVADARAIWLNAERLRWPSIVASGRYRLYYSRNAQLRFSNGSSVGGADGVFELSVASTPPDAQSAERFRWVPAGVDLLLSQADQAQLNAVLQTQMLVVQEDAQGRVQRVTSTQLGGVLDARFGAAEALALGAHPSDDTTSFRLWAPTAQQVNLCVYVDDQQSVDEILSLQRDESTGAWSAELPGNLGGRYFRYLVDVHVPNTGIVRNRVTDPYSLSLGLDSKRSYIVDLDDQALKPIGWDDSPRPTRVQQNTDMVIYELHVRDFSINDPSVDEHARGKYSAFGNPATQGMQHLAALSAAGVTDIHLLPVFDLATVPEQGCLTPDIAPPSSGDSEQPQRIIDGIRDRDCFNWGYDPFHFGAPEGSYASDASDGAVRIREFRQMVQALNALDLRVGMDVVYNHTSQSGQGEKSVLDRIVPGYYQRLNLAGQVETSTCCANTATENRMMAKLMIDTAVVFARDYKIDSFRFDLMGHQPRAAMERLQAAVDAAAGQPIQLLGEGWNFGEVANGQRFEQASQLSLNGLGIGTFSDRARDAIRGGGCCDNGSDAIRNQGFVNGQFYAPNALAVGRYSQGDLLRASDMVRVGLAGSLRDYELSTHSGATQRLEQIQYAGQPAGYVGEPGEVVNYVENHDNQTLYDINVLKLPQATSVEERARVQMLAAALNMFSQGIAYFHAGVDVLRSKSLDRNSYDSGDWFNRIDWSYQDNYFGTGLPPQWDNGSSWPQFRPFLADASLRPAAEQIIWTRDAFLDLLRIRASSQLFRLSSAAQVRQRLRFLNTGPQQRAGLIIGHLDGRGLEGAGFDELVYVVNVLPQAQTVNLPTLVGKSLALHPVHLADQAADQRIRDAAGFDPVAGMLSAPARSAFVLVSH
ncbi:alpha-1,6-glucosidase domain-containing protein [Pseudomarimonas arenosa]|uniref:DUF3372 domain-containing protein n=1 Tax=Pseudomarimonas arenosa TaxID=2774145 RepID=A0AAW3ZN22_9GAMM|nr:alpha-1,6-glucosidase domain-containing protein [Pseudomarimonas arenosa]MBD8527368.1 DUF3372 domain-containing protein [Pseudomarimonas arenosa]